MLKLIYTMTPRPRHLHPHLHLTCTRDPRRGLHDCMPACILHLAVLLLHAVSDIWRRRSGAGRWCWRAAERDAVSSASSHKLVPWPLVVGWAWGTWNLFVCGAV